MLGCLGTNRTGSCKKQRAPTHRWHLCYGKRLNGHPLLVKVRCVRPTRSKEEYGRGRSSRRTPPRPCPPLAPHLQPSPQLLVRRHPADDSEGSHTSRLFAPGLLLPRNVLLLLHLRRDGLPVSTPAAGGLEIQVVEGAGSSKLSLPETLSSATAAAAAGVSLELRLAQHFPDGGLGLPCPPEGGRYLLCGYMGA